MILATYQVPVAVPLFLALEMRVMCLDVDVVLALVRADWALDRLEAFSVLWLDFVSLARKLNYLAHIAPPPVKER